MPRRCSATGQARGAFPISDPFKSHGDALLTDLFKHPGWNVLEDRVNEELERRANALTTLILRTDAPVDQRKVDHARGLVEGVRLFRREVQRGARAFEKGGDSA